ncbi:MAG: acetoin utilization protein AcuC [Methanosarcinales archaeon]|nr:acetoin utilization protein AcuC [Methanosarcinales archaeon]
MIYLYYTDQFMGYNFGPEHPMQPARLMLTNRLIEEFGFLSGLDVERVIPYYASYDDLLAVHDSHYVDAVRSEEPSRSFGLDDYDNPAFPGIYDSSRLIAGASREAAERIVQEDCSAFNFAGGLHHAMPSRASGFCVFNDAALGIFALQKRFGRILYIDIDAHHGDGVQQIFYSDPRVLTVSIHETGKHLFPGTGFVEELGQGEGMGYSVNVPLPVNASDQAFRLAFEEVVPPLFDWFRPEVVVAQLGVDAHYADRMTGLKMTLSGYQYLVKRIRELADQRAAGRVLALGGGGYNLEVVPYAWAMAFQLLRGREMPLDLPAWWVDFIQSHVHRTPVCLPDPLEISPAEEARVLGELEGTIHDLKSLLSEIHGIF